MMVGRNLFGLAGIALLFSLVACTQNGNTQSADSGFSGSESCIPCHERFYDLWGGSFHGKAMQHVNADFIAEYQLPASEPMVLEGKEYQIGYSDSTMVMYEKDGDKLLDTYKITWSLGGHNVFCFLVPLDKGKLQTIPLAYDMNHKTWFNYPQSAMRHFDGEVEGDEALPWKDMRYTFNTGCYSCHVSQLSTNFNLATESYSTTWREAGINCETCHGPSAEHVRIFKDLKEGEMPSEVGLIVTKTFTQEQINSSCAPCHAKMSPITPSYMPGDPYFDNYTLTTLEDRDFYPDGRDLGENYTMTGWMMNKCKSASNLNCITCHTSSGRDRNKDNPNDACISCHKDKGEHMEEHTMHKSSAELTCIDCHAPKREFVGRFLRSDHSFRPPMPEGTIRFKSPNACNMCHTDKSPEWANKVVKQRKNSNYQSMTMEWAQLIKEARNSEWKNLDKMLVHVKEGKLNEVVLTSFIRLLANCQDEKKWAPIINALNNESPLVRAAASSGLTGYVTEKAKNALIAACNDKYRLVRISAAAALVVFPPEQFYATDALLVAKATEEYMTSVVTRPDDWSSHYNMGVFYQNKGDAEKALESYEIAARLYPESLMPLINSSVIYSVLGNPAKAEENLRLAVKYDPDSEAANLNLGLLLAEQGKFVEAEKVLKVALQANPEQAVAAYNLSVITARRDIAEAVGYAGIAAKAAPEDPKFAYTFAYYQVENNQKSEAIETLKGIIKGNPLYFNAIDFLANVYLEDGKKQEAILLYQKVLKTEGVSAQGKQRIRQAILSIHRSM